MMKSSELKHNKKKVISLPLVGVWLVFFGCSASDASTLTFKAIIDFIKQIEPIIYSLVAFFTGFAAFYAWRSARGTREATQSQLYIRLMEEYGSEEMSDALRGLREFKEDSIHAQHILLLRDILARDPKLQKEAIKSEYDNSSKQLKIILGTGNYDANRRIVKRYFLKVLGLYENGFLTEKRIKELGKVAGIDLFYDVIEPLEFALDKDFNISNFNTLKNICGRYKNVKEDEGL